MTETIFVKNVFDMYHVPLLAWRSRTYTAASYQGAIQMF